MPRAVVLVVVALLSAGGQTRGQNRGQTPGLTPTTAPTTIGLTSRQTRSVLTPGLTPGQTPGLTPDEVARQVQDRDAGRDSRAEMRMRLYDRQGRVRERTMTLLTLRGLPAKAGRRSDQGDRTLVRFLYPNDIRNTGLLVWEHPDAEDERFLYLPALGRVRRIAGEEKQESFVGSDLSYEDIGGRDLADYTYAFADENASWTAPDGTRHPAWALESRAKDGDADFPRSVSLVLKDRFVVVHADIHNPRDERAKVFDVRRLDRVEGIWTVLDLVVVNERQRTRTELVTTAIDYNTGLSADDFTRRALETGK